MVASTDIKFYVHTNNSAPQLTNNFGCMLNVLDAALINGIQVGTVSSLTTSGKVVTAVFGIAHNLMQYQVIKIAGANQAEYNIEARILTVPNATTITFELAAAPSVAIATGTINCSLPPLGWEKPFSSTSATGSKGAYRSKNTLLPSRPFLRVVDELDPAYTATYAKFAKVCIVEDMTDIDTMLGVQSPFDPLNPDKNWKATGRDASVVNGWAKWYYANYIHNYLQISEPNYSADRYSPEDGDRKWYVIGTADAFIVANTTGDTSNFLINGFGKYQAFFDGDVFNDFLASHVWNEQASALDNQRGNRQGLVQGVTENMIFLSRNLKGEAIGASATATANKLVSTGNNNVTQNAMNLAELVYTDVDLWSESVFRGRLPFIKWLYQYRPTPNETLFVAQTDILLAMDTEFGTRTVGQIFIKVGDL